MRCCHCRRRAAGVAGAALAPQPQVEHRLPGSVPAGGAARQALHGLLSAPARRAQDLPRLFRQPQREKREGGSPKWLSRRAESSTRLLASQTARSRPRLRTRTLSTGARPATPASRRGLERSRPTPGRGRAEARQRSRRRGRALRRLRFVRLLLDATPAAEPRPASASRTESFCTGTTGTRPATRGWRTRRGGAVEASRRATRGRRGAAPLSRRGWPSRSAPSRRWSTACQARLSRGLLRRRLQRELVSL